MKTSSAKAKGRRAQDETRELLLRYIYLPANLEADDCKPVTMGSCGVDILLSPAAKRVADLCIECKLTESLNVMSEFVAHAKQYCNLSSLKLLFHRRNRTQLMVTLDAEEFCKILAKSL